MGSRGSKVESRKSGTREWQALRAAEDRASVGPAMTMNKQSEADICLILEGTYPYVAGGVSSWTHDLIRAQPDLSFHLLTLLPPGARLEKRYEIPRNVVGVTQVYIHQLSQGFVSGRRSARILDKLRQPLTRLQGGGGLEEMREILEILRPDRDRLGSSSLLESRAAWNLLVSMYRESLPHSSFSDYFWTWRASHCGLFSVLLSELPKARVYHTVSTGYAGVCGARAKLETGRPLLLTEHGIYTNERKIEIAMAEWLYEAPSEGLDVDLSRRDLKSLWVETFTGYSRACYAASNGIITLYEGNQELQAQDGAARSKMQVIPNGIDFERYSAIERDPDHPPTVALIGRVVPIKDIKTYIRACAILRNLVPDLVAFIFGPTDEDEVYFDECETLVSLLGVGDTVQFTGKVRLDEYLGRVDVIALTSISEAQPLVILEAGAAGIPTVATDVGACREMISGSSTESPALGPAGAVTGLSNPTETAEALARLLNDPLWYERCSEAIRERVRVYYNKDDLNRTYKKIYEECLQMPDEDSRREETA